MSLVSCVPRYFVLFVAIVNGSSLMIWFSVHYWCIEMLAIFANWFCILRLCRRCLSAYGDFGLRWWGFLNIQSCHLQIDNLTSSLTIWIPLISFSCITSPAKTSNILFNRSGGKGHPCLVPVFKGNASRFCPFSMILAVGLSKNSSYHFEIHSIKI